MSDRECYFCGRLRSQHHLGKDCKLHCKPTSPPPVDYVADLERLADQYGERRLRRIATQLAALRDAKGCGVRLAPMVYCGDRVIHYSGRRHLNFCHSCGEKFHAALTALTGETPT